MPTRTTTAVSTLDALGRLTRKPSNAFDQRRWLFVRTIPKRLTTAAPRWSSSTVSDEARASYDAALAREPDYVESRWNRGLGVASGRASLRSGWEGYEWRRRTKDDWEVRDLPGPEWDGSPAMGQRVLLYSEQALGDTIQFARFARTAAACGQRGQRSKFNRRWCGCSLRRFCGRNSAGCGGAPPSAFDCHLPLMSVPHVLRLPDVAVDGGVLSRGRS